MTWILAQFFCSPGRGTYLGKFYTSIILITIAVVTKNTIFPSMPFFPGCKKIVLILPIASFPADVRPHVKFAAQTGFDRTDRRWWVRFPPWVPLPGFAQGNKHQRTGKHQDLFKRLHKLLFIDKCQCTSQNGLQYKNTSCHKELNGLKLHLG